MKQPTLKGRSILVTVYTPCLSCWNTPLLSDLSCRVLLLLSFVHYGFTSRV